MCLINKKIKKRIKFYLLLEQPQHHSDFRSRVI